MKLPDSIHFFEEIPIKISLALIDSGAKHWNEHYEIIFVLSGELKMIVDDKIILLKDEDICLINSGSVHEILSQTGRIMDMIFDYDKIRYTEQNQDFYFLLNSSGDTYNEKYNYVRHLMAQFIKINMGIAKRYKTMSLLYTLIDELTETFQVIQTTHPSRTQKYKERMNSILDYINTHYKEGLSLSFLAEHVGLSAPYLSSFFQKNTGKSFSTYYNEVRLNHAVNHLISSDESIEEIALNHGFGDSRTFVSLFKKHYGMLPSAYRKKMSRKTPPADFISLSEEDETALTSADGHDLHVLSKYSNLYTERMPISGNIPSKTAKPISAGTVDAGIDGIFLSHYFKTFCSITSAKQLLYGEVQDLLRRIQSEIGYRYIKFNGLLSDDMMVYSEESDGTPVYSFTLIDKALDFLMEINLKPLIQLSFMPIQLASDPDKMINMHHYNTSPPKDIQKWEDLIRALMLHLVQRYGIMEIRTWLYSVWNEPESAASLFGWKDKNLFLEFYRRTYCIVKETDEQLLFGTPGMLMIPCLNDDWISDFLDYCQKHSCIPDFLNVHYYDNAFEEMKYLMDSDKTELYMDLNTDEYAFTIFINTLKQNLKKHGMSDIPIYMTEWNLTISARDLINDTCFKSCYLTRNLLENYDRLDAFGYWNLTDFTEELSLPSNLYHGGLGMFTYNNIPKSSYNCFRLLTKLCDELIARGPGYFITKGNDKLTLILYNYEHYSKLNRSFDIMTDISNPNAFITQQGAIFLVQFINIKGNSCRIRESYINNRQGSSFETWLNTGAQPLDNSADLSYLQQHSDPGLFIHQEEIIDGQLELQLYLSSYEVRAVEIFIQNK